MPYSLKATISHNYAYGRENDMVYIENRLNREEAAAAAAARLRARAALTSSRLLGPPAAFVAVETLVAPLDTPPPTPEPEEQEFPDRIALPDVRPGSSLSQNSERSLNSNGSGSASGAGSDDEFEPDLGPEDGLGDVEEEVEEGYAVM
ncbi:hypothetical protein K438DRAFT_1749924 [Mycena galopus ATCC 62051]|nr:hypothetical protein K438DRAFT_1749924 [Mycena galopus ATCC 62051]